MSHVERDTHHRLPRGQLDADIVGGTQLVAALLRYTRCGVGPTIGPPFLRLEGVIAGLVDHAQTDGEEIEVVVGDLHHAGRIDTAFHHALPRRLTRASAGVLDDAGDGMLVGGHYSAAVDRPRHAERRGGAG